MLTPPWVAADSKVPISRDIVGDGQSHNVFGVAGFTEGFKIPTVQCEILVRRANPTWWRIYALFKMPNKLQHSEHNFPKPRIDTVVEPLFVNVAEQAICVGTATLKRDVMNLHSEF